MNDVYIFTYYLRLRDLFGKTSPDAPYNNYMHNMNTCKIVRICHNEQSHPTLLENMLILPGAPLSQLQNKKRKRARLISECLRFYAKISLSNHKTQAMSWGKSNALCYLTMFRCDPKGMGTHTTAVGIQLVKY